MTIDCEDIRWLETNGFRRVGHWSRPLPKLQREPLDRVPGVYAFVVDGELRYLGKADRLRSRVRAYNRSFAELIKRAPRKAHVGIRDTWNLDKTVEVWVCEVSADATQTHHELERMWIKERCPLWNG